MSTVDLFRAALGGILAAAGIWLFCRDAVARIRRARETFPTMNRFVALKNTGVGLGFWLGFGLVILGILLLPLR